MANNTMGITSNMADTTITTNHSNKKSPLRIVVFSLEFTFSPFSGNGVYSRSVVQSLLDQRRRRRRQDDDDDDDDDECCVMIRVICGKPHEGIYGLSKDNPIISTTSPWLEVWPVELSMKGGWNRLDQSSPWEEYAEGAYQQYSQNHNNNNNNNNNNNMLSDFQPHVALVIDWHGAVAAHRCCCCGSTTTTTTILPMCYFNFRVYSSGGIDNSSWYEQKEKDALSMSSTVLCLSRGDQITLQQLLQLSSNNNNNNQQQQIKNHSKKTMMNLPTIHLHHPTLRGDMRNLALATTTSTTTTTTTDDDRIYITCAVRLSKEKMPLFFVELMEHMSDVLLQLKLVPLLCGAASDMTYANHCRQRLLKACPNAKIVTEFLGPQQLATIFSKTKLNIHPCHYDAFGMTIVEAAAFGAPSIVHANHTVGATELLGNDGCIQLDYTSMSLHDLSSTITNLLLPSNKQQKPTTTTTTTTTSRLQTVQTIAFQKAMSWDEHTSGNIILQKLHQLV